MARADNFVRDPIDVTEDGIPIFDFPNSFGFIIYVEGRAGTQSGIPGICGTRNGDGSIAPCQGSRSDLEVQVDRPLGNGSSEVCDYDTPSPGGVPGVNPPNFDNTDQIDDIINDFACRFSNHTSSIVACTLSETGHVSFVDNRSFVQYCSSPVIGAEAAFRPGDTKVTVRLRSGGVVGAPRSIIIRVP